jgi:hypothetical protein
VLVKSVLDGKETTRVARAVTCNFEGREISVENAIALRSGDRKNIDFRCIECGKPVRPHKGSPYGAAHFEHLRRNSKCRLSDPER